jgi:hypothetical protein
LSWDQQFFNPIELPGRKKPLVTLRDAAQYILKLPKAERDADEWQAVMQALILVAEHNGPAMFARIGVVKAINRHRGARVQSRPQRSSLGQGKAKAGSMTAFD